MSKTIELNVVGMACQSCSDSILNRFADAPGVLSVKADHKAGKVEVTFEESAVSEGQIKSQLADMGFEPS